MIIGNGIHRFASPRVEEHFRRRDEVTTDEAIDFARICSVTLPPGFLPEEPRPRWDRDNRQLWYQHILCRYYSRENARNQFAILDAFQKEDWPHSIDPPFKIDPVRQRAALEDTLRETVFRLNKGLDEASPIGFKVEELRPAWYRRPAPSCSGKSPPLLR
jgi:hypothetical protein